MFRGTQIPADGRFKSQDLGQRPSLVPRTDVYPCNCSHLDSRSIMMVSCISTVELLSSCAPVPLIGEDARTSNPGDWPSGVERKSRTTRYCIVHHVVLSKRICRHRGNRFQVAADEGTQQPSQGGRRAVCVTRLVIAAHAPCS
jgi:hypothetical protein